MNEFIMVDIEKSAISVRNHHKNRLAIVLHPVLNDYPQTSLVQRRY